MRTYRELIETTGWDSCGRGKDERCNYCVAALRLRADCRPATMGSLKQGPCARQVSSAERYCPT